MDCYSYFDLVTLLCQELNAANKSAVEASKALHDEISSLKSEVSEICVELVNSKGEVRDRWCQEMQWSFEDEVLKAKSFCDFVCVPKR